MVNINEIQSLISSTSKDNTFAEFICKLFKDEIIQVYVGDAYEDVKLEQHSMQYPALFCGKVLGAFNECLIIQAVHKLAGDGVKMGGIMLINERAIRALMPGDAEGLMSDYFLTSKDALTLNKRFG